MTAQASHLGRCVLRRATVATAALTLLSAGARDIRAQSGPTENYAAVDAYVDATPRSAEQSVPALAAYLARSGRDDLTRSRAVYRWVTRHVAYDVAGYKSGNYGDLTPDGVLRRRESVCEGYSRLTQVLGAAMGLEVAMIKGWSKGYSYVPGATSEAQMNHSWNAVKIDGKWRLMDPTWGSGYLDDRMKFVQEFQEHYFLTDPDAFLYDHLPADSRWQFVERPISNAEFADLVYVRPFFFHEGFSIVSHKHGRITATDRTTIALGVTKPVEMAAEVVDAATDRTLPGEFAFVQVSGARAEISAAFPHAGNYLVRVFAKDRGSPGSLDWVLDYSVTATRGTSDAAFPTQFSGFGTSGAWLLDSPSGVIDAGKTYRFRLRAPGATEVMLVSGATRVPLAKEGDQFAASVVAPSGEAVIYARYGGSEKYLGLLRYVGR